MADRLKGWRGRAAIGSVVVAAIVAGAWGKSAVEGVVEPWTFGGVERPQSLAGKIGVSSFRNAVEGPGHRPQTFWRLTGLYSDGELCIAPIQVVETSPRAIAAFAGFELPSSAGGEIFAFDEPVPGGIEPAGFEMAAAGEEAAANRDWEGISADWLGGYVSVSRNPIGVTFVVPYWLVVTGMALLTMLAWRRSATHQGKSSPGGNTSTNV